MTDANHTPVLLDESIQAMALESSDWAIDATFGQGGHTQEMLALGAKVIGFDFDLTAIKAGQIKFNHAIEDQQLTLIRENFNHLESEIAKLDLVGQIQAILFDFGTSATQLTATDRGLSFSGKDEMLDMRLDDRLGVTAKDLLGVLSAKQLQHMFSEFGGETEAKTIAQAIVKQRQEQPIETVKQLVSLIEKVKRHSPSHLHPATKVFQALRIVVNDELDNISLALPQALKVLKPGGKIITIAFHEGEDRIAKHTFKKWEKNNQGFMEADLITPSTQELSSNPRARSAKMRVFTRQATDEK